MKSDSIKTLNILIIEDESDSIALLHTLLGKSSLPIAKIESAKSLKDALELLNDNHFDVALMDLNLPDSRGLDTLVSVREKYPRMAIVVITGEYGDDFGLKVIAMGAQEYLIKGMYDKFALVKSIHYALERKKAEHELLMAEEKYRRQFEEALDAIFIADAESGIIIDCNSAALELVGREKPELVGKHQRILHHPKEIEGGFTISFKQHLKEKEGQALETQVITKNGEIKDVSIKASFFELGGRKVLQGIFRDITEHRQISEILDRKQKNLEAIFDAAPVAMLLLDENMMVKRVNDAVRQMVNKEYSQIIGRHLGDVLGCVNSLSNEHGCGCGPSCSTCPVRKTIKRVLDSQQSVHEVEVRPTLKIDNKEVSPWLSISAEPAIIDGCSCIVMAVDDITERKLAEEKLRETMELKSQFISTVSHELRTPLACVKEAIAVVLDGAAGKVKDKQRDFLDIAARNIDRLAMLINDVLDFQRLEAGRMNFNIRQNDINRVVEEVHRTMFSYARKKKVEFSLELDGKLPKAEFDSDKIFQILTNLVGNAIKFTPEQGRVSVSTKCRAEELVIRVSDTGMGIPKQSIPKIFDRFYRVQRPGKEIQGTGLGLAIVKRIVVRHGGRIELKSELDQGTTFTFFLPLKTETQQDTLLPEMDKTLESALSI